MGDLRKTLYHLSLGATFLISLIAIIVIVIAAIGWGCTLVAIKLGGDTADGFLLFAGLVFCIFGFWAFGSLFIEIGKDIERFFKTK